MDVVDLTLLLYLVMRIVYRRNVLKYRDMIFFVISPSPFETERSTLMLNFSRLSSMHSGSVA